MAHHIEVDPRRVRRLIGYTFINDALLSPLAVQLFLIGGLILGWIMPASLLISLCSCK